MIDNNKEKTDYKSCLYIILAFILAAIVLTIIGNIFIAITDVLLAIPFYVWLIIGIAVFLLINKLNE